MARTKEEHAEYMRQRRAKGKMSQDVTESPENVTMSQENVTVSGEMSQNVTKPKRVSIADTRQVSDTVLTGYDIPWQDVPVSIFDKKGRGVPVGHKDNVYVLIARRPPEEHGVVTQDYWMTRQGQICTHGFEGFACGACK